MPSASITADESFDVVVAQYVVTAVPDPEAALDEFVRVLKPGGEIILTQPDRCGAGPSRTGGAAAFAAGAAAPGWRSEFAPGSVTSPGPSGPGAWRSSNGVRCLPLGHFSLIRMIKTCCVSGEPT